MPAKSPNHPLCISGKARGRVFPANCVPVARFSFSWNVHSLCLLASQSFLVEAKHSGADGSAWPSGPQCQHVAQEIATSSEFWTAQALSNPSLVSHLAVRQLGLCFQLAVRFFLWKFWGSEFAKTRKKIADNAIHDKCSCNLSRNPKLSGKQAVPALCRASLWTQRQAVHEEKPRLADNYCVNQWVYVNLCEPISGFLDVLFETFFLLSVCRAKGISLESLNHWPAPLRLESCYAVSSEVARDKL